MDVKTRLAVIATGIPSLTILAALIYTIWHADQVQYVAPPAQTTSSTAVLSSNFHLSSPVFTSDGHIPPIYTCDGKSISPPLEWAGAPTGTKSFTLFVQDPDIPNRTTLFDHWVLYDIPSSTSSLATSTTVGTSGSDGANKLGYIGPCPPTGEHRYIFTLFALDEKLGLASGANSQTVQAAMSGHVLGQAVYVAHYARK